MSISTTCPLVIRGNNFATALEEDSLKENCRKPGVSVSLVDDNNKNDNDYNTTTITAMTMTANKSSGDK